jgi:hypothetical protein
MKINELLKDLSNNANIINQSNNNCNNLNSNSNQNAVNTLKSIKVLNSENTNLKATISKLLKVQENKAQMLGENNNFNIENSESVTNENANPSLNQFSKNCANETDTIINLLENGGVKKRGRKPKSKVLSTHQIVEGIKSNLYNVKSK